MRSLPILFTLASPAAAGVDAALDEVILPGIAFFEEAAVALADEAADDCRATALAPAYQTAFDTWMQAGDWRLGPTETAALSIAHWPDEDDATPQALAELIAAEDPAGMDPDAYADAPAAARGLFALDHLLYDEAFAYTLGSYTCTLVATIAVDLAIQARALASDWDLFAEMMRTPGAAENAPFLDEAEVRRAIYAQLLAALDFTIEARLGRPLGAFDEPRPRRWRSRSRTTRCRTRRPPPRPRSTPRRRSAIRRCRSWPSPRAGSRSRFCSSAWPP